MFGENQQKRLNTLIFDSYGTPEELSKILDLGIEMLFYLEDDTFERREVQHVVSALRKISIVLRQQD